MKRWFALFALAGVLCAGIATLCTSCVPETEASDPVSSTVSPSPVPEETLPATTSSPEATPSESASDSWEEPDLRGVVIQTGQGSLTLQPIVVESVGGDVAVAAGGASKEELFVDTAHAVWESVRVYEGGHDPAQPAQENALQPGCQVYLYGKPTEKGFEAERVLMLEFTEAPA